MHFKESAYWRYGGAYQKRGIKYEARKYRRFGHSKPMVWSGAMRRQILGFARITSNQKKGRVQMTGVRALNLSAQPNAPDFKAELKAVNQTEMNWMAKLLDNRITSSLNKLKRKKTTRAV